MNSPKGVKSGVPEIVSSHMSQLVNTPSTYVAQRCQICEQGLHMYI